MRSNGDLLYRYRRATGNYGEPNRHIAKRLTRFYFGFCRQLTNRKLKLQRGVIDKRQIALRLCFRGFIQSLGLEQSQHAALKVIAHGDQYHGIGFANYF